MITRMYRKRTNAAPVPVCVWKTVVIVAAVAMVTVYPPTALIADLVRQVGARVDPPFGFAIIKSVHAMTQRPYFMLVRMVVSIAAVAAIFEAIFRLSNFSSADAIMDVREAP